MCNMSLETKSCKEIGKKYSESVSIREKGNTIRSVCLLHFYMPKIIESVMACQAARISTFSTCELPPQGHTNGEREVTIMRWHATIWMLKYAGAESKMARSLQYKVYVNRSSLWILIVLVLLFWCTVISTVRAQAAPAISSLIL